MKKDNLFLVDKNGFPLKYKRSQPKDKLEAYAPYEKDFFDLTDFIELLKVGIEATEFFELLKSRIEDEGSIELLKLDTKLADFIEGFKSKMEDKGFEIIQNQSVYKVDNATLYHYELALFLLSCTAWENTPIKKPKLSDFIKTLMFCSWTDKDVLIDHNMIRGYYLKGYLRGLQEWIKEYRLAVNQPITETYLNQLRHLYFNEEILHGQLYFKIGRPFYGCSFVKGFFPKIISLKGIESIGYYSAFTYQVDKFVGGTGLSNITESEVKNNTPPPQQVNVKINAKHHVLTYLLECNIKGEIIPIGNKKKIEEIGSKRIGKGKGNTFYKNLNQITNKDLNVENNLIEIGGENWKSIILKLSSEPEEINKFLKKKGL